MQAFRKFLYSLTLILFSQQIHAQGACEQWLGKLASAQGKVEIRRAGSPNWRPVMRGERYCDMDAIRTGRNSRAVVMLNTDASNRTLTNINQNTFLTFKSLLGGEPNALELLIDLLKGGALFRSRQPNRLGIETPYINAAHRGTEFFVRVDADQTLVTVYDGQVATSNTEGKLTIDTGETALAKRGKAPVKYALVRPRDAVQWALNYPPVIDYHAASSTPPHPAIGDALSAYRRGELLEALAILDKVPEAQREPDYYTTKAGLLLSVGRADEATPAIEKALTQDSKNATAFALKSVIAVAQNENDQAMQLAERAAQLDPKSPTPQVALSYAHQAKFELEKALESAEKAVELGPGNALALSRLSELQLSMGDLDEALEAAEKATALDPDLARTQTVLGFAYLTKIDIDEARQTFEKAIELDQAAPLPHLGLGLAKIRKGELKNGTDEIEIAASLDPDNSLIRSYLGKAFYEKKENILAGTELEIAKELDPNDPTPWFYDAIRKQTTNRPVEALHDMQKAIELNDNRAVYRSRLLLDDDLAARSAALGRIYNDLGFQQRGLLEGWKSVNTDPSDYSAHRLLADNYAALPRHEIARVSELLQSQLLQPLNVTPVQPQLAETNLFILNDAGPANTSFNEFNPLFRRNRLALQASGVVGNHDTYGDEVTQSGVWNQFSYSLGQFHYETDGFQKNSNLSHNIYNAFAQAFVSPFISIQAEFRHNETKNGDLRLQFDPADFNRSFRRILRTNTARIGVRLTPATHSTLIASGLSQGEKEHSEFDSSGNDGESDVNNRGYLGEIQYLFRTPRFTAIIGGGYFHGNEEEVVPIFEIDDKNDVKHANGYIYSYTRYPSQLTWTLGISFDHLKDENAGGDIDKLNPKVGLLWDISQNTILRLAAFRTLKRSLLNDQTIEPTQVAGFNQFFDDLKATESKRYGIGLDHKFKENLFAGVEISKRDLEARLVFTGKDDWNEELYRGYINWALSSSITVDLEYRFEKFRRENGGSLIDQFARTDTHLAPITINFFRPSGFFSNFGVTYVDQEVEFFTDTASGSDNFLLFDVGMGFRLPKRYGIISIAVRNLFDKNFRYQGDSGRTLRDDTPPFLPERSIVGQITLPF